MMGYANGQVPEKNLVTLPARFQNGGYPILMTRAAADSILRMEEPFRRGTGLQLKLTDGYRPYSLQRKIFLERYVRGAGGGTTDFRRWGGVLYSRRRGTAAAAVPGTSNHGQADPSAADFAAGINSFGSVGHRWMQANAHRYGWVHPKWARSGSRTPEAWHWEHSPSRDPLHSTSATSVAPGITVREAQTVAASLGVPVRVDGIDGPETARAVRAAQEALGVTVDGVYGPKTKEAYVATLNDILARLDAIGARVETNNQALGRLEHVLLPGIATDVTKTKEAVGRMESEHGPGKTPTEEAAK